MNLQRLLVFATVVLLPPPSAVHAADPQMILQACVFEIVSKDVEKLPVPAWAFKRSVSRRNSGTFATRACFTQVVVGTTMGDWVLPSRTSASKRPDYGSTDSTLHRVPSEGPVDSSLYP